MKVVGLIGFGAIGELVASHASGLGAARIGPVLVRKDRANEIRPRLPRHAFPCEEIDALLAARPDMIVECAGQDAVRAHAPAILAAGVDFMPISTGALADHDFRRRLIETAQASGARILIPAGATAGLDGLGALAVGGLTRVIYTSTKPPHAWRGTPAEALIDLGALREPATFYEGPADEAALRYPKNANLAASGYPMLVILKGLNGMPPLGQMMTDQQVADVVNYVRTHFGNKYKDAISAADVKAMR